MKPDTAKGEAVKRIAKSPYHKDGVLQSHWKKIAEFVKTKKTLDELKEYFTEVMNKEPSPDDIYHIYNRLLQGKYNYEGERVLVEGDLVHCDDLEYGNGIVKKLFEDSSLILVKFIDRDLPTMCDSKTMTTVHDEVKRKFKLKGK